MSDWKPRPAAIDLTRLPLAMEEAFVFTRLDGQTRVRDLSALTGFPGDRIEQIVRRLLELGAVLPEGAPPAWLATAQPVAAVETEAGEAADSIPEPEPAPTEGPTEGEPDEADDESESDLGDSRALYAQRFRQLSAPEREAEAGRATGDSLSALCHDPLPEVIRAVLQNSQRGPTQARLIARHHHTAAGIGFLLANVEFARDSQVRRLLLRNPQLNAPMLAKLYAGRRLREIFAAVQSHEITDHLRRAARDLLRQRFAPAPPEEKFDVIWSTEGRVLPVLIGVALDSKTVQLFCQRVFTSVLLIQNFARWPPTPQALLRHLLSQAIVVRTMAIKNIIKRHPNAPKDQ